MRKLIARLLIKLNVHVIDPKIKRRIYLGLLWYYRNETHVEGFCGSLLRYSEPALKKKINIDKMFWYFPEIYIQKPKTRDCYWFPRYDRESRHKVVQNALNHLYYGS